MLAGMHAFHVGEACPFAAGPAVAPITRGQRQRAQELGWRFTSLDADLSAERQAAHVAELVGLGVDALTAWTLDPELLEPAYAQAVAAGTRLVLFGGDSPLATTAVKQRA